MPELPEVEFAARGLRQWLDGRCVGAMSLFDWKLAGVELAARWSVVLEGEPWERPEPLIQALPLLAGSGLLPRVPMQPGADLLRLPGAAEQHGLVEVEAITVEVPAVPQVFEAEDRPP